MSELPGECRQAINSVVCGLLRQYHCSHGLCVWPWTRSPGPTYFSFYCMAARNEEGWPLFLPDFTGTYCLTIHQSRVGVPSWSGSTACDHEPVGSICDTEQLRGWYDQRLSIDAFLRDHTERIVRWRYDYPAEDAERYLLTVEVAAATAVRVRRPLLAYDGNIDGTISDEEFELQRRLRMERPHEQILRAGAIGFSVDGRACLPSGEILDLRDIRPNEGDPERLADDVIRRSEADAGKPQ